VKRHSDVSVFKTKDFTPHILNGNIMVHIMALYGSCAPVFYEKEVLRFSDL